MAVRGTPNSTQPTITSISSVAPVAATDLGVRLIFDPDADGGGGSTRTFRGASVDVLADWTEAVDGFVVGDVSAVWYDALSKEGSIDNFSGSDGDRSFGFTVNLPQDSSGEVDITIAADSATATNDSTLMGPSEQVIATLIYDTTAGGGNPPTVNIIDPAPLPWRSRELPLVMRWSEGVNGVALTDIGSDVGVLSDLEEIEPDLYEVLLTLPADSHGDVTITITEESARGAGGLGPPNDDYTETFAYDTRGADTAIASSTTLCEETYTFANNPHFTGAFASVLEMLVHSGYVYFIVQFIRDRGSSPTNFLARDTRGASALFRVAVGGGSCERLASFDDVLSGARSLCVFDDEVHYFRGSHYLYQYEGAIIPESNANWREQVGEIWKLNGTTPELAAKTGRTGQVQDALPGDADYDPHYSIRGGTVSPLVAAGDELYYLAGFGDLREIGASTIADDAVDDIRNWELSVLTEEFKQRVPVLETNDRPGWESVKALGQLTRSRIGFRGDEFRSEPTAPRTAKLAAAITDTDTVLTLKALSRSDIPNAGTLFIQGELITYTSAGSGHTLTGLTRGAFETTADGYQVDDTVVFVDHRVSEYVSLSLSNDPSRIYNHVTVHYGDNQEFTAKDDTSIDAYGKRELELTLPIGAEQTAWAASLAGAYLADFKDAKTVVTLTIEMDENIETGDVVFVKQEDRAHLLSVGQVAEVRHSVSGRQRNQAQTTGLTLVII